MVMKQVRSKNADYDEIELAIISKYKGVNLNSKQPNKELMKLKKLEKHKQQEYIKEDYKASFVRKGGLLDQQLFLNDNAPHSYAERKWKWHGEESGKFFKSQDLDSWYKHVNQAHLLKVRQVKEVNLKNVSEIPNPLSRLSHFVQQYRA